MISDEDKADEEGDRPVIAGRDAENENRGPMDKEAPAVKSYSERFVESWSTGLSHITTATIKEAMGKPPPK